MKRLLVLLTCLLATCSPPLPAQPEQTSPEPSLLRLTEVEVVSILGPGEYYSVPEIATIVLELQAEAREEIRITSEVAAAETARPLLAELASAGAERDSLRSSLRVWRWGAVGAAVVGALVGILVGIAIK